MNLMTYEDLVADSLALAQLLPRDLAGVLAVPRSGLAPASIIAQELGLPVGDVFTYAETGEFYHHGSRMNWCVPKGGPILVVDDSCYRGRARRSTAFALRAAFGDISRFRFAAIYVAPGLESQLDYWARAIELPRLSEWNWLHSELVENSLCDLDGIIAVDPTVRDDDPRYPDEIETLQPLHLPRRGVGVIVTGRLERWRSTTEAWLRRWKVGYGELLMAPFSTVADRAEYGAANWKADVYVNSPDARLYIESNEQVARSIAGTARRPVFCPIARKVFT